jgi:vacuolar-type H+-ATPase subunit H
VYECHLSRIHLENQSINIYFGYFIRTGYMSSVESIVSALSELESDIDSLSSKVDEMKKSLMVHSEQEISNIRERVIEIAKEEAEKIMNISKEEAEKESAKILVEADQNLTKVRTNIESSFNECVDIVLKSVFTGKA